MARIFHPCAKQCLGEGGTARATRPMPSDPHPQLGLVTNPG